MLPLRQYINLAEFRKAFFKRGLELLIVYDIRYIKSVDNINFLNKLLDVESLMKTMFF